MRCFCCCAPGIRTDEKKKAQRHARLVVRPVAFFHSFFCCGDPCFGTAVTERSTPPWGGAFRNKDLGMMMVVVVMMIELLVLGPRRSVLEVHAPPPLLVSLPPGPPGYSSAEGGKGYAQMQLQNYQEKLLAPVPSHPRASLSDAYRPHLIPVRPPRGLGDPAEGQFPIVAPRPFLRSNQ